MNLKISVQDERLNHHSAHTNDWTLRQTDQLIQQCYFNSILDVYIPKTAFVTPDGHWEFLRRPFWMVNSGATMKRGLSRILKHVDNVLFYWDDILVHTSSWEDHIKTLRELFQRLKKADLTIRPSKCILGADNVDFIGHRLIEGVKGLTMTTCGRSWKQPDLPPRNKSAPSWGLPTTIGNMSPTSQL